MAPASKFPNSFVYRINLATLAIDQVTQVGAVPKFVAVTPNGKYVLVSNWCSYTESVIDAATGAVVQTITVGAYPRGIAVDSTSSSEGPGLAAPPAEPIPATFSAFSARYSS